MIKFQQMPWQVLARIALPQILQSVYKIYFLWPRLRNNDRQDIIGMGCCAPLRLYILSAMVSCSLLSLHSLRHTATEHTLTRCQQTKDHGAAIPPRKPHSIHWWPNPNGFAYDFRMFWQANKKSVLQLWVLYIEVLVIGLWASTPWHRMPDESQYLIYATFEARWRGKERDSGRLLTALATKRSEDQTAHYTVAWKERLQIMS